MANSTRAESFGLVTIIKTTAPANRKALRSAIEMLTPKAAFTWVVSAVSRETISPLLVWSKKAGSSDVRWPNTAERRSATTRSPSVMTR
ncbi:MAG: hypothetical protein K0S56_3465 [Microvirga sp.]|nr:hypothetical protein [Microvirga sp.]